MSPKKKRKLWNDDDMSQAIDKVQQGSSVRAASIECNVPRKTLEDRINSFTGAGDFFRHGVVELFKNS